MKDPDNVAPMHPEDEPPLTLSKWPFYLGDGLLVATALAIAILGEWNLSNWQVLSCVLAVALGAGLLCLPFVFEHWLRVREQSEDRNARIRVAERRISELTELSLELREESEERQAQAARIEQANEAIATMVDRKLAAIEKPEAPEPDPRISGLTQTVDRLESELASGTETAQKLADGLTRLESELKRLKASGPKQAERPPAARPRESRKPRQPNRPEPGLLHRAIKDRPEQKPGAVSRIIESKAKGEGRPTDPAQAPPKQERAEPEAAKPPASPAPEERMGDAAAEKEESPKPPADADVATAQKAEESSPVPEPPTSEGKADTDDDLDFEAEVPPMEASDLLFDSMPESARARKPRTKKSDTVLTVNVLIGIGNKPYIRGSGGGLDWDKGLPLEFESIGSWRWVAPPDLEEPVSFLIFRNDEDPDRTGKHELNPGDKLEIEPRF